MKDELYELLKEYREERNEKRPIEVFHELYLDYYSRLQREVKEKLDGDQKI